MSRSHVTIKLNTKGKEKRICFLGTTNSASHELLTTPAAVNLRQCQTRRKWRFSPAYPSRREFVGARAEEWKGGALFCSQTFSLTPRWEATKIDSAHVYLRLVCRRSQQGFQRRVLSCPPEECGPLTSRRRRRKKRPWNHGACVLPGVVVPGEPLVGFYTRLYLNLNRISHKDERTRSPSPNVAKRKYSQFSAWIGLQSL